LHFYQYKIHFVLVQNLNIFYNEAYFVNFKNGTVAGPALTQTIKVNKYRGEVIDYCLLDFDHTFVL
jgi:hypothetical protein